MELAPAAADNHTAASIAGLLIAGIAAVSIAGARDRRSFP